MLPVLCLYINFQLRPGQFERSPVCFVIGSDDINLVQLILFISEAMLTNAACALFFLVSFLIVNCC